VSPDGIIAYRVDSLGHANYSSQVARCPFFAGFVDRLSGQELAISVTCPCGYTYIIAPLKKEDVFLGSLLVGPFVLGEVPLCNRPELFCQQPRRTTQPRCNAVLHMVNMASAELSHRTSLERWENEKRLSLRQNLTAGVQSLCRGNAGEEYPVALEKDLQKAILSRDTSRTRDILNRLLSHIFYAESTAHDSQLVLSRILELLTLISRSAVEAGADSTYILAKNALNIQDGVKRFSGQPPIEDVAFWLNGILEDYTSLLDGLSSVPHGDMLTIVKNYMLANYMRKLPVEEIADQVFLSPSYLSRIFKAETGIPLSSYLNQIRVEQSKYLLLYTRKPISEIFALCGFEDQSYFTKVFRQMTGISPGRFREGSGNMIK